VTKTESTGRQQRLRTKLRQVFTSLNDEEEGAGEFVFHMLDWKDDLDALIDLYENPDDHSVNRAEAAIQAFLIHAVGHLNAAARLALGYTPDPFAPPSRETLKDTQAKRPHRTPPPEGKV